MSVVRRLLVVLSGLAVGAAFLAAFFGLAGGWGWRDGWSYLGILALGHGLSTWWVGRRQPELLRRRGGIGRGTKPWDLAWLAGFAALVATLLLVAAAEIGRTGPAFGEAWRLLGILLYAFFLVVLTWCMVENPFFEKTVRIQTDRAQRVIASGPYAIVRHPGYAALIPGFLFGPPLLLRSDQAFLAAAVGTAWVIVRTTLEDRTLRRELEGYARYARRVRYRLLPGVW